MTALPAGYELTDDPARIDAVAAHAYLASSYWSPGIPLETVARAIANSLSVAVLHDGKQVAMARLVTDFATMAYLADVYVIEEHRPELQGLRRWLLFTRDAHSLYERFGWTALAHPERAMLQDHPDVYA